MVRKNRARAAQQPGLHLFDSDNPLTERVCRRCNGKTVEPRTRLFSSVTLFPVTLSPCYPVKLLERLIEIACMAASALV